MLSEKEYVQTLNTAEIELYEFYRALVLRIQEENGYKPLNVLEVGSGWGLFSRAVLGVCKDPVIWTIDSREELKVFDKATEGFSGLIKRVIGKSRDVLPKLTDKFDLALVDGSHIYHDVKFDIYACWDLLKQNGTLLVDDLTHPKNWLPHKDSFEYGVTVALFEFLREKKLPAEFVPKAYGTMIVKKN